jgi:Regulator of chromosome condensation (RCC1) repeat
VKVAVRKRRSVRLTRWVLIPLAAAVSLLGLSGPAGASGSPSAAAPTLANVVSVASAPTGHSVRQGNGTWTAYSDVPVAVSGISNAAAVTGGPDDFCALLSTGHVDCWGYNSTGQLGNGTTTGSDVPVAVLAPN